MSVTRDPQKINHPLHPRSWRRGNYCEPKWPGVVPDRREEFPELIRDEKGQVNFSRRKKQVRDSNLQASTAQESKVQVRREENPLYSSLSLYAGLGYRDPYRDTYRRDEGLLLPTRQKKAVGGEEAAS